jgi:hypothetical protein
MRGLLESPRRRKRAAVFAALALVAGVGTVLGLEFRNTSHEKETFQAQTPRVIHKQRRTRLSAADRRAVFAALDRFVETGVSGRNLRAAYDLATANFRGGISRRQWVRGDTPIYPYPVVHHSESIAAAYRNDVMMRLILEPRHGSKLGLLTVDVELKASGTGVSRRWLVDYFLPRETLAVAAGRPSASEGKDPGPGPHLSQMWLLVPALIFGMILFVPIGIGLRDWLQGRAAERRYGGVSKLPPLPPRADGD